MTRHLRSHLLSDPTSTPTADNNKDKANAKLSISQHGLTQDEESTQPCSYASSPFDFFHYYNGSNSSKQAETGGSRVPNCSLHVDPGFLTAIPAATQPGYNCLISYFSFLGS